MNCLLDDAGIAIGLTSLPFRQEINFYNTEIRDSLFPSYKKAVLANFPTERVGSDARVEFEQALYEPVPYYLFGSFDLAVVTLIDDFEMTSRTFRAFDPMLSADENKPYRENFFYKVITGPTPKFKQADSVVKLANRTFLRENRLPLFAMSLLKVNNALLLGNGTEFLRVVVRFIHAIAKEQNHGGSNLQWVLLESYSAHEITLLVFSDSYAAAAQLITAVRESRVRDVLKSGASVLNDEEASSLVRNCLFADLPGSADSSRDLRSEGLFTDTDSYFGFDFRLLDPANRSILERIDAEDHLDLYCQWSVRPGYLHTSFHELVGDRISEVSSCVGRGDLFEQTKGLTTRAVIERVLNSLDPNSLPKNAKRKQSMPGLPGQLQADRLDQTEAHVEYLTAMPFTVQEIKEVQDHLRALWAPKILTGKVINTFTNFNDGILDPSLYGYFVELLPLMESVQRKVAMWSRDPRKTVCVALEEITDNFERAYRNRFYNSYRMGDITDFNLDFKGGIQQLLTSFDGAYKGISSVFGTPETFAYVAGSPGVYSTQYEVRLNYYHVFQPEIFGCIANHEAANFYFSHFADQELPWFSRAAGLVFAERAGEASQTEPELLASLRQMRNDADPEQQYLFDNNVSRPLLQCIFVDLLAFYFGYNRDRHLFSHWYWGSFAQSSVAYSRTGHIDELNFLGFMLRMLWIERISGGPPVKTIQFGNESFARSWNECLPILKDFIDWLWSNDKVQKWNADVLSYVEKKFLEVHRTVEGESVEQICTRIDEQAAKFKEKLARGEVCLYEMAGDQSMFKFTEQLLYAYLSLLADRFAHGDILLTRSQDGRPDLSGANKAEAMFDPIGGIFTHDPVTRRQRFRYRAGFTMSLWDMAQKEKKAVVLRRLNRLKEPTGLAKKVGSVT